jgi:uncharacterized membrane protein
MTPVSKRPEPDGAALPDPRRPGIVRIIATILLGCAMYSALVTVVGVLRLGTIGVLVALVVAVLATCRITGLRGRWTHLLIGLAVFFGTAGVAMVLVTLLRPDLASPAARFLPLA